MQLLTTSDVARLYSVDLKTIHNWVNAGKLTASRTPGGHLRFAPATVLADMRRYYLSDMIPDDLVALTALDEKNTYGAAVGAATFLVKRGIPVPAELTTLIGGMTPPAATTEAQAA